ncbi:MbnH family di-heme enzyme [Litorilituus sediminis]|uniref:Di-heme enzyme n=1 Tax=Litorilituus sediminis TaxID=718192 RepID=A0A4P6PAP1_9GAMM|nr:MbnH family di-heme enzyme [Litorilituus sediminis]QBG36715.1 di-heme enzyme [Litorilituus sediminis]
MKKPLIILLLLFLASCSQEHQGTPYQWPVIDGFPKPQVPKDNPMTVEKVELGRHLFYEKQLSFNQKQSCAGCHQQDVAFGESIPVSIGSTGQYHRRNSQALVNVAYNKTLTWSHDGITSLEQQILLPMFGEDPIELGITGHENEILARFRQGKYPALFEQAFPGQAISYENIVKALASFVRSLISLNSPFDRYAYYGEDDAISASALKGMELFFSERFECHHCHGGFNFTQSTSHEKQLIDRRPFHNTGLYNSKAEQGYPKKDKGLAEITTLARDDGRFRAPTLRNIAKSAPYMHDGSVATLSEVLDIYAAGGRVIVQGAYQGDGRAHPEKSQFVRKFAMTAQEKADLLAFLHTLTDEAFLTNPNFAKPSNKDK